jgi:LuxR family maltose regulon positive regulatory protein
MTMTFSIHESIDPNGALEMTYFSQAATGSSVDVFPIVREKLRIPDVNGLVARPRINNLLDRSRAQFPATLISGRSGTGKTAIAASFAAQHEDAAWYSVESNDTDWSIFARYFAASLQRQDAADGCDSALPTQDEIAGFLSSLFCLVGEPSETAERSIMILDDIHHIFDAPWFDGFFNLLLYSLPPSTHLVLLCRSRPPNPLWRLRSKQILNVLDEKVIAFDPAETEALFRRFGLPVEVADRAQRDCFGRVGKLLETFQNQGL